MVNADNRRPSILLVTRNLPPLVGGMERMMLEVCIGASDYAEVTVIGPRGCREHLPAAVEVIECPSTLAGFLLYSMVHALKLCRRHRYDVVLGGSGLAGPCLAAVGRLYGQTTAVFLHGLDVIVPNPAYQRVFIPCLRRVDKVMANSHNTARLARDKGVDSDRITVINPGCHPPDPQAHQRVAAYRQRYHLGDDPLMLFVGRMTARKGLSRFINKSLPAILENVPRARLLVVGDDANSALNRSSEIAAVNDALQRLPNDQRERIQFLGQVDDDELFTSYAAASVHVFPILDLPGDVEGFGMVVIEAAAYGTPTVAFAAGGVADAVGSDGGVTEKPGDYMGLSEHLCAALKGAGPAGDTCQRHADTFLWPRFHAALKSALFPRTPVPD